MSKTGGLFAFYLDVAFPPSHRAKQKQKSHKEEQVILRRRDVSLNLHPQKTAPMLEVHAIRENAAQMIESLKKRNKDFTEEINAILALDEQRRSCQQEMDQVLSESNVISKQIGDLFKTGKKDEANEMRAKTVEMKERSQKLKDQFHELDNQLTEALYHIPNVPHATVPAGKLERREEKGREREGAREGERERDLATTWELYGTKERYPITVGHAIGRIPAE